MQKWKTANPTSLYRIVVGNDIVLKQPEVVNVKDSDQGGNVQEHVVNAMNEIDGQHKRLIKRLIIGFGFDVIAVVIAPCKIVNT